MGAGTGERMDSEIPKQFIEIERLPIIIHSYNKLKSIKNLDIIIVLPEKNHSKWKDYISNFIDERTILVRGGITRNISVRNGINSIKSDDGYVLSLIHISEPTRQAEISYAVFCLKKNSRFCFCNIHVTSQVTYNFSVMTSFFCCLKQSAS